ncbi:MAG: RNA polymerase sigma-70 factor [Sediminibacterium sp.]
MLFNLHDIQQQVANGNQEAFRRLYDTYFQKLFLFAKAIVKTRDGAIEVVDEVLVNIWKQREQLSSVQNLRVYLYTATKNKALSWLSSKANQQISGAFDDIDIELYDAPSPEQQMITAEILDKIHAAIEALPPRCKMIFKLVREDGLKYREVAEVLNIADNTVDAQMVIAVKKISDAVRQHFDHFPAVKKSPKKPA